jgi:hypothetical protein
VLRSESDKEMQSRAGRPCHFYICLRSLLGLLCVLVTYGTAAGQYISADTYTRYELLAPETHQFKIIFISTRFAKAAKLRMNR